MKLSIVFMTLCTFVFANSTYTQKGEIDMHGGKTDKLGGSFLGFLQKEKNQKKDKKKDEIGFEKPIKLKELKEIKLKKIDD